MKSFQYFQPTEIRFGAGRVAEVGEAVRRFGNRCLLVTDSQSGPLGSLYIRVKQYLEDAGVSAAHFDGAIPNPTTDSIAAGTEMAVAHKADVMLGVGGGSAMDSAKAIAVEATHKGTCWDYLYYRDTQPTEKTLPIVAVSTTSGTGSQVTQVAVVTNPKTRDKSAIFNPIIYPRVALVDPELMLTLPPRVTASTGFDAFAHAFESYLHPQASPYTDMMALEAIRLVAAYLPAVLENGSDLEARSAMAWADTLAGLCIANAGVTLPHGVGMAIGGMYPHVAHGEAVALIYPAFTRYTCASSPDRFVAVGRILEPALTGESNKVAAERACEKIDAFIKKIGLWAGLDEKRVPQDELSDLAKQSMVLPDYKNNPRVADLDDMRDLLAQSYRR
jgi:alcohol dehydrogenase class IV